MKGVDPAIGRDFPPLGHARQDGFTVIGKIDQALEQGEVDIHLGNGDIGLRIDILRFRVVAKMQDLVPRSHLDPGGSAAPSDRESQNDHPERFCGHENQDPLAERKDGRASALTVDGSCP